MSEQTAQHDLDVAVIGAGFAGMYMLHRLREAGFNVRVFERAADVGGTWYWNRYPGARCDVESMEYSYQFDHDLQQEWDWSERYATQGEILAYANHVAERFDLRRDIQFGIELRSAQYDEAGHYWRLAFDDGSELLARYVVFATGCLSVPKDPELPCLDDFQGRVLYTSRWPHAPVEFSGRRVGVIGTGSSGIQSIPIIAEQAEQLMVFQRTPSYSLPAYNEPMDTATRDAIKANYEDFRARNQIHPNTFGARFPLNMGMMFEVSEAERQRNLETYWGFGGLFFTRAFADIMANPAANEVAQEFARNKIRERVNDPALAEMLCPDSTIGCKRVCADTNYYETYNRDNVTLVNLKAEPLVSITASGLQTEGASYELDDLVLATGFDAMTGALLRLDIRGRGGLRLQDKWEQGPQTLLGMQTSGFPNLFMITGPGSPSVLSNMIQSIEQNVEWIAGYLQWLRDQDKTVTEAEPESEQAWMAHVAETASETLFNACTSWYRGNNIEGKAEVFMPLVDYPGYCAHCAEVAAQGYSGFAKA